MAIYAIQNKWGGNYAPWHDRGVFVMGDQATDQLFAINVKSNDNGQTLIGTVRFQKGGDMDFKATAVEGVDANNYSTQVKQGSAAWQNAGYWLMGSRGTQRVVELRASADPNGNLNGQMTYSGEGGIALKATLIPGNAYWVKSTWGGNGGNPGSSPIPGMGAPMKMGDGGVVQLGNAGVMVLGNRAGLAPIDLDLSSNDGGQTLTGSITYDNEKPTSISGKLNDLALNTYILANGQGNLVIGSRTDQNIVKLEVSSTDNGKTLNGEMQYAGDGVIGFSGTAQSV